MQDTYLLLRCELQQLPDLQNEVDLQLHATADDHDRTARARLVKR